MAALLLTPGVAAACGPFFDNPRLSWVGRHMLDAPTSHFKSDAQAIARATPAPEGALAKRVSTADADAADLRAALAGDGSVDTVVAAWLAARKDHSLPLPAALPPEFRLYAEGIRALHAEDWALARERLESVLALPAAERQWRSTWAAYMLPKVDQEQGDDVTYQLSSYGQVVALAAAGFADTPGLAAASLRQRADLLRATGSPGAALEACVQYRAAGGQRQCQDLKNLVVQTLETDGEQLGDAVGRPSAAAVIAAFLTAGQHWGWTARPGVSAAELHALHTRRWLEAVEADGGGAAGADRLAWAAYQVGLFDEAERWVKAAGETPPMARWMAAKLALRRGALDEAIGHFEAAVAGLPAPSDRLFSDHPRYTGCAHHPWDPMRALHTELGVSLVAADRYEDALEAFLRGGNWLDAAWVAERLLTTDELLAWVTRWFPRQRWPADSPAGQAQRTGLELPDAEVSSHIRHLLARRLAREGRWSEAMKFYPSWSTRRAAAQVRADLGTGRDPAVSPGDRGAALWRAAWTWKMKGWDLVATEMDPDFRVLAGRFQGPDTTRIRAEGVPADVKEAERLARRALAPTDPERGRAAQHGPPDPRRYHFVYTAQDLAWEAVSLMPKGHPDLVEAVCVAGGWTRARDVDGAARFWTALGEKGRGSPLGQALLGVGWFPPLTEDGECADPREAAGSGVCGSAAVGGGIWLPVLLVWRRRRRSPRRSPRA